MSRPSVIAMTGATGFLGGALAQRLLQEGHIVRAISRSPAVGLDDRQGIQWQRGDLADPEALATLVDGADRVIHAAGILGQFGIDEATYQRINAEGTRRVLAAAGAQAAGRPSTEFRVLHVGSAGVLGPIHDGGDDFAFDETMPMRPSNAYERSKAAAENYAREFALAGLPVVIARPEFVYGPGDLHVLGIFRAVQRGFFFYVGSGRNHCHPTYIDDAIDGMLACLERGHTGQVYQIAGLRPVSFEELAETMADELGVSPPRLHVPRVVATLGAAGLELLGRLTGRAVPLSRTGVAFFSESRRFSIEKARREIGYSPQTDLREGISRTVAWYRAEGLL